MDKRIQKLDIEYIEAVHNNKSTALLDKKSRKLEAIYEQKKLKAKHMFENLSTDELKMFKETSNRNDTWDAVFFG